jgi:hypothetical protein
VITDPVISYGRAMEIILRAGSVSRLACLKYWRDCKCAGEYEYVVCVE